MWNEEFLCSSLFRAKGQNLFSFGYIRLQAIFTRNVDRESPPAVMFDPRGEITAGERGK